MNVNRQTVDLAGYPDLVVIYLGMWVNRLTGTLRVRAEDRKFGRRTPGRTVAP
jgi:hypothetical protein